MMHGDLCSAQELLLVEEAHLAHTRSEAPASTGEESREAHEQLAWGLAFPEATRAGPTGPRRKARAPTASRKNPGDCPLQGR